MGCSNSRYPAVPNNPLQMQQYLNAKRERRKRKLEKQQKRIIKLQEKLRNKKKKQGAGCSRISDSKRQSNTPRISNYNYNTMRYEFNKEEYDRNLENKLKTQLDSDLCLFITNQISLSMQFFRHFESEINVIGTQILSKENEINQQLEEHSILLGNPLDVCIKKWLKFRPMHGIDKHNPKPLQTQTMYVVFENIDIARPNDANYDSISPICKVDMDTDYYRTTPTKEDITDMLRENKWKGYVRLKMHENVHTPQRCADHEIYTDGSSGYSTTSQHQPLVKQSILVRNEGGKDGTDYAYVTSLNSPKPLTQLRMPNLKDKLQLNEKVLPECCIVSLNQFVEASNEDDTDEEREDDDDNESSNDSDSGCENEVGGGGRSRRQQTTQNQQSEQILRAIKLHKLEQERRRLLLQQQFLSSQEFMRYFGELVRYKLAEPLQIPTEELQSATYIGASIHTTNYQIIPAIHVAHSWPDCAFQFKRRERPISTNPHTGEQSQWPTRAMISRVEGFGFHVIPMGFAPKRQRNPFRHLEWRIVFPKAERYLERNLSATQIKVFMMTKALVKTFVESQEKENALIFTIDYLRTHLFWECERNYVTWSDEFLGEVLLHFIQSFMVHLREKKLKDFFIEERNLFESIPDFSLLRLYQILADIVANPLLHLMVAFRNLHFEEDFFPKLNFRKLYDNLSENNIMKLKVLTKNSRSLTITDSAEEEPLFMEDEGTQGLLGRKAHHEKTKGKLRRRTQVLRHNIEVKKQIEMEKRRVSIESIDVEFFFNKNLGTTHAKHINQGVENLRRTNILEIILDHLLATAEFATKVRSVHSAQMLLEHARRLCKFYHNYGCDMGAQDYLKTIQSIENEIAVLRKTDANIPPPTVPVRTSVEPIKSRPSKTIDVRDRHEHANGNIYVVQKRNSKLETSSQSPKTKSKVIKIPADDNHPQVTPLSTEQNLENTKGKQQLDVSFSPIEFTKSIKFIDHVVEVYEGDSNPIKKPEGYSPVSILRSGGGSPRLKSPKVRMQFNVNTIENVSSEDEEDTIENVSSEDEEDFVENRESPIVNIKNKTNDIIDDKKENQLTNGNDSRDQTSENIEVDAKQNIKTTTKSSALMNTFGSAANKIRNCHIAKTKPMIKVMGSTEKFLNSLELEEKGNQVCEIVKRNTLFLKGALNQSTET